jgi:hypothetical protein
MKIYLSKEGKQAGPFSDAEVRAMLAAGDAFPEDLARREGAPAWQPLRALIGSSPVAAVAVPAAVPAGAPGKGAVATPVRGPRAFPRAVPARPFARPQAAGPTGVGGWLIFFCVGLTILSPIYNGWAIITTWNDAAPAFALFPAIKTAVFWESLTSAALIAYGFLAGCAIWSGSPRGRDIARKYLFIRLFGFVALEGITLILLRSLPTPVLSELIRGLGISVVREVIYFLIWWSYFKSSARVRNTYGAERA